MATASSSTPATAAADEHTDDLMARVVSGAHDTIDRLAESAAPHVERLSEAGDLGEQWTESARDCIRDHPLASVAVALAAGVLLARVLR